MGLLNFPSAAAYARTGESLDGLGTATTIGVKLRIQGAYLLSGAQTGSNIFQIANETRSAIRIQLACAVVGGSSVYVAWAGPGSSNPSLSVIIPVASLSASEYYIIRAVAGPGGCTLRVDREDGSEVDSSSAGGVTISNNAPGNGFVHLGATSTVTAGVGALDGIAFYSQASPAGVGAPHPTDPGILWAVLDGTGQIVAGATELVDYSGATWGPGGEWHAPEPPLPAIEADGAVTLPALQASGTATVAPTAGGDAVLPALQASGAAEVRIVGSGAGVMPALAASGHGFGAPVWGVLGDSNSDEYNANDNRPAHNWTEMWAAPSPGAPVLEHSRGVDLGAWGTRSEPRRTGYANNYARSGSTMVDVLADQLSLVAARVSAGEITHVVLFGTGNEWGNPFQDFYIDRIYNGNGTVDSQGANVQVLMEAVAGRYATAMDTIVGAGLVGGMVVVTVPRWDLFPVLLMSYTNPTRLGYVGAAVQYCNGLIVAHADSVNAAAGRTVIVTTPLDAIWSDSYPTADGDTMTMAGVELIYSSDAENGEPEYFAIAPQTAIPHPGTIAQGALANTVIAAANQLPGIQIAPFSDREIRENAGIFLDAEIEAEGVATLPALEAAGSASVSVEASAAAVLPALESTASASVQVPAAGAAALPALESAAEAATPIHAQGAGVLPALEASGTAASEAGAVGNVTIPALAASGAARVEIRAIGAATLPALEASGSAEAEIPAIAAIGAAVLPALGASGTAVSDNTTTAVGAAILPAFAAAGVGSVHILGIAAGELPGLRASGRTAGAYALPIHATLSVRTRQPALSVRSGTTITASVT